MTITGPDNLQQDDEAVYTCTSYHSAPEPQIVWNILSEGKLHKIQENETDVKTENSRAGVTKTSKYTLQLSGIQPESIIVYCVVEIAELKFKKSSGLIEVLIICKLYQLNSKDNYIHYIS